MSTDDRKDLDSIQTILDFVDAPPIVSGPVLVDQAMIDSFARTTHDMQWIHVEVARAERESPYGGTIAHGFLTLSLISAWYHQCFRFSNRKLALNYGFDKVRFLGVVPSGSQVVGSFRLAKADRIGENDVRITWTIEIRVQGAEKPAMVANWITQLRY